MKKRNRKVLLILILIFLFTTLSGAIRKWGNIGGIGNFIFFIQLCVPYLFFAIKIRNLEKYKLFNGFVIVYLFLLFIQALNPLNLTIYHGLLGILLHFGFWFMLYIYINNREFFNFKRLFLLILIVSGIQIFLGITQYFLPADNVLNRYSNEEANVALVSQQVRITGTFSYIAGYAYFFLFIGFFIWALLLSQVNFIYISILILLSFIVILMNGGRAPLLVFSFIVLFGLFYSNYLKRHFFIILLSITIIVGIFSLNVFNISETFDKSFNDFYERVESNKQSGEQEKRIFVPIENVINFKGKYPIFGIGLGATYQGAVALWGISPQLVEYGWYEYEGERIVLEGGYILLIFKLVLWILVINYLFLPKLFMYIFCLFTFYYLHISFNIFSTVYLFLGIAIVDSVYYNKKL